MIDSHAHLNDPRFEEDLPAVLERAKAAGVRAIINIGYDLVSSKKAVELAAKYPQLYAVIGVHPHDAKTYDQGIEESLKELAKQPKVVAIGETGLDYHYDNSPRAVQREVFQKQLLLAGELNLPAVIHSRDASQDTLEILRKFPGQPCLLHCYSGSFETAEQYLKLGHYFSFAGPITFKNATRLRGVAKRLPLKRLMIETDCPYLAPQPRRGRRNEPAYLPYIAEKLAEIHGRSREDVERITAENTENFFRLAKED
ncbi:MAG TPA: TatD family hydrolase [Firmicutes bacterium]|nr:TatD family hydrolase [Bacillota bacterium]